MMNDRVWGSIILLLYNTNIYRLLKTGWQLILKELTNVQKEENMTVLVCPSFWRVYWSSLKWWDNITRRIIFTFASLH